METRNVEFAGCRVEVLTDGDTFRGLGRAWIGATQVRSGRLPLVPYTQTFKDGLELTSLHMLGVDENADETRIRLRAGFRPLEVKLMRDHSFDPIHELGDWDAPADTATGALDIVLRPAQDSFNGVEFTGFSYHYEYQSEAAPIFYLLDKASWELDGDITGATVYSQSSCSAPVATFAADTAWTTEGVLHFATEADNQNSVMTHNLPRWASHGSFDFQHKGDATLIGVFAHVDLIRSVIMREPQRAELKTFDKHIFDQATQVTTTPKAILLNTQAKTLTAQQNLWTWVHCAVEDRARAEFGLKQEPFYPRLSWNFWNKFTVDSYYKDLVPAAESLGIKQLFVDNLRKSSMTEQAPMPGVWNWNMCCGHQYEIADALGGNSRVKAFVEHCQERGIRPMSWTNNDQALSSPINKAERDEERGWFVKLEDTRQKYGGAYAGCMSVLDYSVDGAREYFVQSHIKIKEDTGLDGYLFDSFYNLGFMPVSYRNLAPRTMWRGLLQACKELQDAGVNFLIESFGPFGMPQHGHPSSYNFDTMFICYRVGLGSDYSTVPTDRPLFTGHADDAAAYFYCLGHMAEMQIPLFKDGKRIDEVWGEGHRQALRDYHASMDDMVVRYLQEDGHSVLWHDAAGERATVFNFVARDVALPGRVSDTTTGQVLPAAATYALEASHAYSITADTLPTSI